MRKDLYLPDGRLVGWYYNDGYQVWAYLNTGRLVGYYNKNSKTTYDQAGRVIQYGGMESLAMLIMTNFS